MKQHTQQFINSITKIGRRIDCTITYTSNGVNHILDSNTLVSISPVIQGDILKSVMKQLNFSATEKIDQGTIIKLKVGLQVDKGLKVKDINAMKVKRLNEIPVNLLALELQGFEYLDFGNYIIKDEPIYNADTGVYTYTCYDKMLYAMKDYEDLGIVYPITVRNYINAICTKLGLTFKDINTNFANYNRQIQNELYLDANGNDLGYTFRDVLDELAQVTASTICINEETDELEIRYINNTNTTIDENYLKDVNVAIKEKYGPINAIVLSRSAESDNVFLQDDYSVAQNGLCEIKIVDNQIMNWNDRSDYLPDILQKLDGTEYYINDLNSTGILWYELCDRYNVTIENQTYSCVLLNDEINIQQGLEELIYTDMPEKSITDYKKADKTDRKINQTYLIVDKQNQKIESVVSEIGDRSQKTTTITEDIDGIQSAVQDIEDLTNTVKAIKTVSINDAYPNNDILELHIYGNNTVFDYLYPTDTLYPRDNLYPYGDSRLRFYNSKEDKTIDLGIDEVLRANQEVQDEVFIDYEGNVSLIRRVNKNGTTKGNPITTHLGTLHFKLIAGTNTFEIVNYNAMIEVKYAQKNSFTEVFATKAEMDSEIKQTAQEINLQVRKKVDENEVISKINQSAEEIQIEANKISLAR